MKSLSTYINESLRESEDPTAFVPLYEGAGYDAKDEMRINDIVKKSNDVEAKKVSLASQMAKAITDKSKALRRYMAALDILGAADKVTAIFKQRANELGVVMESADENTIRSYWDKLDKNERMSQFGHPQSLMTYSLTFDEQSDKAKQQIIKQYKFKNS